MKTIPQQLETTIYISDVGNLCIKQEQFLGEDEHIIIITPNNINQFLRDMRAVINGEDAE